MPVMAATDRRQRNHSEHTITSIRLKPKMRSLSVNKGQMGSSGLGRQHNHSTITWEGISSPTPISEDSLARRTAMIDRKRNKPRKARKSRNRKEFAFDQHRLQGGSEEMALCPFFASYGVASNEHCHRNIIATIGESLTSIRYRLPEPQ